MVRVRVVPAQAEKEEEIINHDALPLWLSNGPIEFGLGLLALTLPLPQTPFEHF
jgi:hypothetical protein